MTDELNKKNKKDEDERSFMKLLNQTKEQMNQTYTILLTLVQATNQILVLS